MRALGWPVEPEHKIYPEGRDLASRRRFERVALSLPKSCANTELAAWIGALEIHPEGPVRFLLPSLRFPSFGK